MKNFLLLSTLFASLFVVVNCAPNRSANSTGNQATAAGACPSGTYYSNGQCFNSDGSINGASYNYSVGYYADNYSGFSSLQITNPNLMKQLYKYGMGVCDRGSNNYGQANCDYYITGQTDIIVQFPNDGQAVPSNALITIFARPRYNQYFNYQASAGPWWATLISGVTGVYIPDPKYYSGAWRNPLQIQAGAAAINNNNGFQVSGYGDAWTGYNSTLLTIEVTSGNLNSSSLNYVLKVGGQQVAVGRMSRCQNVNCGI